MTSWWVLVSLCYYNSTHYIPTKVGTFRRFAAGFDRETFSKSAWVRLLDSDSFYRRCIKLDAHPRLSLLIGITFLHVFLLGPAASGWPQENVDDATHPSCQVSIFGGFHTSGKPKMDGSLGEILLKWMVLEVPLFQETSKYRLVMKHSHGQSASS